MKLEYADHDLDTIVGFWVKHYELPAGQEIRRYEYFIDPVKNKVVFRLWVDDSSAAPHEEGQK